MPLEFPISAKCPSGVRAGESCLDIINIMVKLTTDDRGESSNV